MPHAERIAAMPDLTELRERPHWSFSALNGFINVCALQWAFRYIYRIEPESTSVALVFGSAFHAAADWLARQRMKGLSPKPGAVADCFAEAFGQEIRLADNPVPEGDDDTDTLHAKGRKMAETLCTAWPEDERVLSAGEAFCVDLVDEDGCPVSHKPLIGEYDCIVKNPDGAETILDWKTSARKWSAGKAERDLQPTAYLYARQQQTGHGIDRIGFRFDVVTKAATPVYSTHPTARDQGDVNRMLALVATVQRAIDAEVFLPNEQGYFCGGCSFAGTCKEWHRRQARSLFLAA
jgi:putative RecB family exonuclease